VKLRWLPMSSDAMWHRQPEGENGAGLSDGISFRIISEIQGQKGSSRCAIQVQESTIEPSRQNESKLAD